MTQTMRYVPSTVSAQVRRTTLGLAWRAADLYALEPTSVDAIAEAADELTSQHPNDPAIPAMTAAVYDAACHLAASRLHGAVRPDDTTSWAAWQASAGELWPILIDAAHIAYQRPVPDGALVGHYEIDS